MQLSKEVTKFYLSRLRLFYNPAQIAEAMGRSRPSVDRWLSGQTTPRAADLEMLENALDFLLDDLIKKGFPKVADAIDDPRPSFDKKKYWSAESVRGWLTDQLKKPQTYDRLLSKAEKVGITRSQLHHASKKLGVDKNSQGYGPHKISRWKLP